MPVEHSAWVIPAVNAALGAVPGSAKESTWDWFVNFFGSKKTPIAVTGMMGVGKTVLFDYLSGEGHKRGYKTPGRSIGEETKKVAEYRRKFNVHIVPGQRGTANREAALAKLFHGKRPVTGAVHVTANGYAYLREEDTSRILRGTLQDLKQYRAHQLNEELLDIAETCEYIRHSLRRHQKPRWLLVAVTKADLYSKDLELAKEYYSPLGDSVFVAKLRTLQTQVGVDNFTWDALPVCSCLEDFQWLDEIQRSTVKPEQRDSFLMEFAKRLKAYAVAQS